MTVHRRTATLLLTATAVTASLLTVVPTAAAGTPGGNKLPTSRPCCGRQVLLPGESLSSADLTSSLTSLGLGVGPSNTAYTYGGFYLTLQSDGNLVEYETGSGLTGRGQAVWSTQTQGAALPTRLTFQRDGNVVLYDANNAALFSTGTRGKATAYFSVYGNGQIVTQTADGRVLSADGPAITPRPGMVVAGGSSPTDAASDRQYDLRVQDDGNVVEYVSVDAGPPRAVWSTGTAGAGPVRLVAQSDGNLVLYQRVSNRVVWQSGTAGRGAGFYYQLDVQADANVVLYRTDGTTRQQAVWASYTRP